MFQSTPVAGRNSLREVTPLPSQIILLKGEVSNRSQFLMKNQYLALLSLSLFCILNASAADLDEQRFEIRQIQLQGNTLLQQSEVDVILAPFIGQDKNFANVQEALDALQAAYQQRGYTLVTPWLPEQSLEQGTIVVRIIEPKVKGLHVSGNREYSEASILRALPDIKMGEAPNVAAISSNIRLANENPGRKINVNFKNLTDEDKLEADVQVAESKPWRIIVATDNSGSKATGRYRFSTAIQHNNLFERDQSFLFQYTTAPGHYSAVKTAAASYRIPLYSLGDSLDFFAAWADVDSSRSITNVADVKLNGKGNVSGIRYNFNLPQWGFWNHKLVAGIDYRLYKNDIRLNRAQLGTDVAAHPFSLAWGGNFSQDRFNFDVSLGVLHNNPWGSKGGERHYNASRLGADASYTLTRLNTATTWQTENDYIFRFAANAQQTQDRLIAGEQFGLGGATAVRGYEEREESWDSGYVGTAEIYSPNLASWLGVSATTLRLLGFYDTGRGKVQQSLVGERDNHRLYSYGWGMRANSGEDFSLSLDVGYARKDSLSLITKKGDTQVHFKANVSF